MELAMPADDADLRHILADTPMPGSVAVTFRREPSYFAAAAVEGPFRQVVACRDTHTGRLVGFGCRSIRDRYVNGRPEPVGYLSNLRLLAEHRNRGLIARGYAYFQELHGDGRTRLYLTTITVGNETALRTLTTGRAGLPAYHHAGRFHTAALPLPRRRSPPAVNSGLLLRAATAGDLPAVLAFLEATGPRRQFFPRHEPADFCNVTGGFQGLRAEDLLLAERRGRLVGTLAGWDQHAYRQTVVHGYGGPLRWARPVYNAWAVLRRRPWLPAPGQALRYLTAALPVVADDDPAVFAALLDGLLVRAAGGPWQYLLAGLHEADPLLPVLRRYRATWYVTNLYLVCWDDGEELRARLDGRAPYLELGAL
jgi:hypothetical protein